MKKILIILAFFFSVCHAQIVKDISVYRGDSTRIEFKVKDDLTSKGIIFVVKLSKTFSSPRLIQKKNSIAGGSDSEIVTTYSAPQTKITVILTPEDTRDLNAVTYYYDIVAADANNLESYYTFNYGKFTFINGGDVQTPFDGTALASDGTRITTVALQNATSQYSTVVWDTTGKYYYPISLNDFKSLLNISGTGTNNPDSLGDKPASDYVDKTTTQTITGEKTFSNNKTVFGTTTNDSVRVTGRFQAGRLGVGGKPSSTGLTVFGSNIRQIYTNDNAVMYTLTNTDGNDNGVAYFGVEPSTGGVITTGSDPFSVVLNSPNGFPIHFATGNSIQQSIFHNESKTVFYSDSVIIKHRFIVDGELYINGNLYSVGGSVSNADSLGGVPASGYQLKASLDNWTTNLSSGTGNELRLGKSYNTKRFNNGAYSDVWNIDYVVPPYNLSATWLNSIEHRTDYYNDTLQTVTHSDILNVDGTGTPIWRTNDVRIMGNEIAVNVGDLPDSTALDWSLAELTGNKVILSEANKTAVETRFPMPVRGYEFKFGSTPNYIFPYVYGFYSDLTSNSPSLETAYHFYGKGNFPSYFGGDIQIPVGNIVTGSNTLSQAELGYLDGVTSSIQSQLNGKQASMGADDNYVTDAEKVVIGNTSGVNTGDNATNNQYSGLAFSKQNTLVSGVNIKTINGNSLLGSGNLTITTGTDSSVVNDLIQDKLDSTTSTSTYTVTEIDSVLTLAQTLINALRGGNTGQVLVKNSNTDFDFIWADIGSVSLTDNTPTAPATSFVAQGGTSTTNVPMTWTDPSDADLAWVRIMGSPSTDDTTAMTKIDSVAVGTQTYTWTGGSAGTTYWFSTQCVDDSGNVSYFSNRDSATTLTSSSTYTSGAAYVWNHLTEANNTILTSWEDSTANLAIYSSGEGIYTPTNVDSGVVWTAYDQYLRQAASFPAGLFDGALTIEMVVKVARIDSSQCLFQARNATNIAMGVGIGATGIFVGNAYDATGGEDYTHNSTATTGWHHLVYTWNGTTTTAFYVDGNLVSDTGDLNQYDAISGDSRVSMGKTGATNFPICSGTLTPYIAIYKSALNSTQVSNNYNSTVIQSQIPAWAR